VANLDRELTIKAINGVARIVHDEIEDTYDQCFEERGQMVCTISHSRDSTARGGLQKNGLRPSEGRPNSSSQTTGLV